MDDEQRNVRMEIKGLMLDPSSNVPIVVLREVGGEVFLPIWIGVFEANAIALKIEGVEPPRPLTHDLLQSTLERLEVTLEKVVICDLKENTFYALLHLRQNGDLTTVDARPSDAIALALRAGAPIFVRQEVLDKAQAVDLATRASDEEKLKKWLEDLKPEDLGKYTM